MGPGNVCEVCGQLSHQTPSGNMVRGFLARKSRVARARGRRWRLARGTVLLLLNYLYMLKTLYNTLLYTSTTYAYAYASSRRSTRSGLGDSTVRATNPSTSLHLMLLNSCQ